MTDLKICSRCRSALPVENFDENSNGEHYKNCNYCRSKRRKYYRAQMYKQHKQDKQTHVSEEEVSEELTEADRQKLTEADQQKLDFITYNFFLGFMKKHGHMLLGMAEREE